MLKCPLDIREWLQTVSLSLPIGCKIFIAGGYPLSEYMSSWETTSIDIFMLGHDIIKDKIEQSLDKDMVKFYGRNMISGLNCYIETIDGWYIRIFYTNDCSMIDIIHGFDMDICQCFISDLETVDWNIKTTIAMERALETKTVTCTDNDVLFCDRDYYDLMNRVRKYKSRLPDFRFIKEL